MTALDAVIARELTRTLKADLDVPDNRIMVKVDGGVVTPEGVVAAIADGRENDRIQAQRQADAGTQK